MYTVEEDDGFWYVFHNGVKVYDTKTTVKEEAELKARSMKIYNDDCGTDDFGLMSSSLTNMD